MSSCPSHEKLTDLLADVLSVAERNALARHVEGCTTCQRDLACLTGAPDTEVWRLAGNRPLGSGAEERMLLSLKQMPPWTNLTIPAQTWSAAHRRQVAYQNPVLGHEWPTVPGYEILGELGRGGMGVVYKAQQLGLHRTVALKMIRTGIQAGAKDLARFRAEAEAIARLQHPNIVQIYDVGEAEGRPYFVLEFVSGGSLAQHLQGKPQPARPAAHLIETLARAVHAAHTNGVIHRDLKPANILLQKDEGGTMNDEETHGSQQEPTLPSPPILHLASFVLRRSPTSAWPNASTAMAKVPRLRESYWERPITWLPNRLWFLGRRLARLRTFTRSGPSCMNCSLAGRPSPGTRP